MYRKVSFYTTADGKCPVAEFIDSQPAKVAQKIAWVLKAVQEIEKVPKTYFKKLSDTDFYEVRIELSGNIYRLLGFFHNGNIVILTNGFQKKTQKTTKSEIEVCEARMKDFLTACSRPTRGRLLHLHSLEGISIRSIRHRDRRVS